MISQTANIETVVIQRWVKGNLHQKLRYIYIGTSFTVLPAKYQVVFNNLLHFFI